MSPINPTNGGVNPAFLFDVSLHGSERKTSGGMEEPTVKFIQRPPTIETEEGLGAIPDEEPVRDDDIGQAVRSALNFSAPEPPPFV